MDITMEVMLPERGAADFGASANPKYRVLAPVAVYELKTAPVIGMQRTGYLHVTNMPIPPAWGTLDTEEIRKRLNIVLCESGTTERRAWQAVDVDVLSPPILNALLVERQATITWGQLKALFRHRNGQQLSEAAFS